MVAMMCCLCTILDVTCFCQMLIRTVQLVTSYTLKLVKWQDRLFTLLFITVTALCNLSTSVHCLVLFVGSVFKAGREDLHKTIKSENMSVLNCSSHLFFSMCHILSVHLTKALWDFPQALHSQTNCWMCKWREHISHFGFLPPTPIPNVFPFVPELLCRMMYTHSLKLLVAVRHNWNLD